MRVDKMSTTSKEQPAEQNASKDLVMFDPKTAGSKREEAELRKEGVTPDAKKKKVLIDSTSSSVSAALQPCGL